jgi:hypothetical protein
LTRIAAEGVGLVEGLLFLFGKTIPYIWIVLRGSFLDELGRHFSEKDGEVMNAIAIQV